MSEFARVTIALAVIGACLTVLVALGAAAFDALTNALAWLFA